MRYRALAEIVVHKRERRLEFVAAAGVTRHYRVALGENWAADKEIEGDLATPLGEFYVCAKNPRSKYFLSLCISYPNAEDAHRGLATGLIDAAEHGQITEAIRLGKMPPQHTRLGGEIYIHGRGERRVVPGGADGADGARDDWTSGCIALDNHAMQELYDWVPIGTKVTIVE